ncbi:MAG: hypothetical protein P1P85_02130 [Patescibacteria group bacterium]|nr:hypothetical protein [Patescibacteria group bacterium]
MNKKKEPSKSKKADQARHQKAAEKKRQELRELKKKKGVTITGSTVRIVNCKMQDYPKPEEQQQKIVPVTEKRETNPNFSSNSRNNEFDKDGRKTTGNSRGIIWLNFFEKKLNQRGPQIVASHNGTFVVPDRDGHKPQLLLPHPCLHPGDKPLFTTKHFGDVYTVLALNFKAKTESVNGTKIIIIDSEVSIGYDRAKGKTNKVVIMLKNNKCHFIWIKDEKKRAAVLHSLNHAEKTTQGTKNSWTHRKSGMLKPPEYSMLGKNEIIEIVSNAFDKPLSQLIEKAGTVIQKSNGQQIITMGVT